MLFLLRRLMDFFWGGWMISTLLDLEKPFVGEFGKVGLISNKINKCHKCHFRKSYQKCENSERGAKYFCQN